MRTFTQDKALAFVQNELLWGAAAGSCRTADRARRYAEAGMRIVPSGSDTMLKRGGNPGDNFYCDEDGNSINALGIPSPGIDVALSEIKKSRKEANRFGAQSWASISAGNEFIADEYHDMAHLLEQNNAADVIGGNFSCGNMVLPDGTYKPIVCYDLGAFEDGVQALAAGAGNKKTEVKLTPTTERRFLIANVEICLKYGIDYITMANTVPNCYLEKPDGTPGISMVLGGGGGKMLIPIVTGMLKMTVPMLKGTNTKVIAAGGVDCGAVAYHYLKHKAAGFVFGTALWKRNFDPRVGQEIIMGDESRNLPGLVDLLVKHGLPD